MGVLASVIIWREFIFSIRSPHFLFQSAKRAKRIKQFLESLYTAFRQLHFNCSIHFLIQWSCLKNTLRTSVVVGVSVISTSSFCETLKARTPPLWYPWKYTLGQALFSPRKHEMSWQECHNLQTRKGMVYLLCSKVAQIQRYIYMEFQMDNSYIFFIIYFEINKYFLISTTNMWDTLGEKKSLNWEVRA